MLRKITMVALIGVMLFGLAAAAVDITFWHPMSTRHQTNLQVLIDEFHAEFPDIHVTATYQGSYSDLEAKIGAAVVAGGLPTVAQVYENWVTPIQEILYPIGNFMTVAEVDDIVDGLVPSNTYNGILTTVPFNKSIMVLYYREDLVPVPPATWGEYLGLAAALTTADEDGDGSPDFYGVGFNPVSAELFLTFLAQAGASILSDDWSEVTINDLAGLQAAQFLQTISPYSFLSTGYMNAFFPQKLAMFIDTSAGYYYNNKACEDAGVVMKVGRVPAGSVSQDSMIQGTNLAIFDTGDITKQQKDAAIDFVKFLIRADNQVFWAINSGYQPVVESAYETQEWIDYVATHEYQQAMSAQMLDGFSQILHPAYGDMRGILSAAFEEILTGAVTPQAALDYAASELEFLLDE